MRSTPIQVAFVVVGGLSAMLVSLAFLSSAPAPRGTGRAITLRDGVIRRSVRRGGEQRYLIALGADEYARIVVEQRGIDIIARIRNPAGTMIAEVDDAVRLRENEQVEIVAADAGTYALGVEGAPGAIASGAYTVTTVERRHATDRDRARQRSRALRLDAARREAEGCFEEARASLELALDAARTGWGDDDVQVATVSARLASVYGRLANPARSESLYEGAIALMDRRLGAEHPVTASVRVQLADLYQRTGDRRRAEPLLRDSLAVLERTVGQEHPFFITGLIALGDLRDAAGDLDDEETIIRRALAISERIDASQTRQYAWLLNNLGEVYRQKQDYVRASELFERSLALDERLFGSASYAVATALQNLGIVARERRDYAAAEAYNMRALRIREAAVGSDHPDVAHILINLANISRARGDYQRSLDTDLRALRIWERAPGSSPRAVLLAVGNIARTYAATGDVTHAVAFERRADAIVERQLALNALVGSERQKLAFARSVAERTDRTISLHLREAPDSREAAGLAALVLLQRKGRVLDSMADTFAAVRQHVADVRDRAVLDALKVTATELSRIAVISDAGDASQDRRIRVQQLEREGERLEAQLSEHSAEFRARMQTATLPSVQAALPDDAVLLEFTVYRPFDPRAERSADAYGPARYAAYVIGRWSPPSGIDLGPVSAIDPLIDAFRRALRNPGGDAADAQARALCERLFTPLQPLIGNASRLLVSPDGELNLLPFEALLDRQGRYLITRYSISYLTSGRDLLRMHVARAAPTPPVIVADPLYGESRAVPAAAHRRVGHGGTSMPGDFAPLAATAAEADAIAALFPEAVRLTGRSATKAAIERLHAPLVLHIASHGFFVDAAAPADRPASTTAVDNPLVRSGIALANANLPRVGGGDGILTALEASGLDLWGTRLVTLSACDTGVGEVRNGEGVYGLRRAFEMAGAETVVMSLWPISDYVTRDTMVAYYAGLRAGLGRGDALRRAKLAILSRPARRHPYYWAAFIQSGDWTSMGTAR